MVNNANHLAKIAVSYAFFRRLWANTVDVSGVFNTDETKLEDNASEPITMQRALD